MYVLGWVNGDNPTMRFAVPIYILLTFSESSENEHSEMPASSMMLNGASDVCDTLLRRPGIACTYVARLMLMETVIWCM